MKKFLAAVPIIFIFSAIPFSCASDKGLASALLPDVEETAMTPEEPSEEPYEEPYEEVKEPANENEEEKQEEKQPETTALPVIPKFDFENADLIPLDEAFFITEDEIPVENEAPDEAETENDGQVEEESKAETETETETKTEPESAPKTEEKTESKTESPAPVPQKSGSRNAETQIPVPPKTETPSIEPAKTEVKPEVEPEPVPDAEIESEEDEEDSAPPIIPSRAVKILKGQYLDINYPGLGWIYLGELDDNKGASIDKKLAYFGRKLGGNDTTFTLRSRKAGTAILHFYKNDNLTGTYIDDYLEVVVEDRAAESTVQRTTAPSYAEVVPKKPQKPEKQPDLAENATSGENTESGEKKTEKKSEGAQKAAIPSQKSQDADTSRLAQEGAGSGQTIIQTAQNFQTPNETNAAQERPSTQSAPEPQAAASSSDSTSSALQSSRINALPDDNDSLFEYAQKCYDEKKYSEALSAIQKYLDSSGERTDEALYLQGLIYEADSPVQNIRNAIDCFDSVVKNHPASVVWKKARNRSIYLKRFYVEIR